MSIRQGLLALLQRRESYGYQLRSEFEQHTGGTWTLNIGQVYTTLNRLERDGLVQSEGDDEEGRRLWSITPAGRAEVLDWFHAPVRREDRPRDELAIKLALSTTVPGVDAAQIVQTQRIDTYRVLQQYTRMKALADKDDLAWSLVLDGLIFQAEAEVRWLDHCESRIVKHQLTAAKPTTAPARRTKPAKESSK